MKARAATEPDRPFVEVREVTKHFAACMAVDKVSFPVGRGEFLCILGPSGCGKTTLLRIIAGLEAQDGGAIHLGGRDVSALPTGKRQCGIVFQSYALFPNLRAWRNVAYGLRGKGLKGAGIRKRAMEHLEMVGLAGEAQRYPAQLSGGQQQRVALARALATEPQILLLDEPFSALDARVRVYLRHQVRQIQRKLGITTIMVTHDQEEALTLADRVVVMDQGRLAQAGTPTEIYHAPCSPFVADFIGSMNFLDSWSLEKDGIVRRGDNILRLGAANGHGAGREVTLAIRPEDVLLSGPDGGAENTLHGTVREVEFRGATYRLRVALAGGPELDVDVQPDHLAGRDTAEGAALALSLPADRLLAFSGATEA